MAARSDIGQATAYEFARNGFDIILAARDSASLVPVRSDLEIRHGVSAFVVDFDAEKFETHKDFYAALPAIPDVVLYSVGYLGEQKKAEGDWVEAEKIIAANYLGAVSLLSIVANDFEERKQGTIIGISSVAGDRGRKSIYIYGSSKAGFTAFLAGLRHRLASSNVSVMTVKPGFVATKMTAEMELPKKLTADPAKLGSAIYKAFRKKKHTLYYVPAWRWIMLVIRNVPESIFVRTRL